MNVPHRAIWLSTLLITAAAASGCATRSGSAGLGALGGAVASVGGYEYYAKRQLDRLEDDLKAGRISREEYEVRKDQIQRGSLFH